MMPRRWDPSNRCTSRGATPIPLLGGARGAGKTPGAAWGPNAAPRAPDRAAVAVGDTPSSCNSTRRFFLARRGSSSNGVPLAGASVVPVPVACGAESSILYLLGETPRTRS